MATALFAKNLDPAHEKAAVGFLFNILFFCWRPEAWPSSSGIKLCVRRELRCAASCAHVHSLFFVMEVFPGKGSLSCFFSQYLVGFSVKLFLPFFFRVFHTY